MLPNVTSPDLTEFSGQPPETLLVGREAWQFDISSRRGLGNVALSNLIEPLNIRDIDDPLQAYDALMNVRDIEDGDNGETASLAEHVDELRRIALGDSPQTVNPFLAEYPPDPADVDIRLIIMADPKVREFVSNRDVGPSHQELVDAWPKFITEFTAGVQNGISLGYIPTEVEGRLEATLTQTNTRMVDAAILNEYMAAYYRSDRDEVGLRHDIQEVGDSIQNNLVHEFTHKISGGTFIVLGEAESGNSHRPRTGFSTEIGPEERVRTGLNEAITQHLTMSIVTGDFETLDPDQRNDGDKVYYEYRKLVATFIDRSSGLIGIKTLTNAFYEDTGPEGGTEARRKLINQTVQAYGTGALAKLDKLCKLTELVEHDQLDEVVFSRIHPPELDQQGIVVARGWIDTNHIPTLRDLYKKASGNVV